MFGRLVDNPRGEGLLLLRRFAHLKAFWRPVLSGYEPKMSAQWQELLADWETHLADLAALWGESAISSTLRSQGVFEVVVLAEYAPTAAQIAAYEHFLKHERSMCATAVHALRRYYQLCRAQYPECFEAGYEKPGRYDPKTKMIRWDDSVDYPDDPDDQEMAEFVEFRGVELPECSSYGMAPVCFWWDCQWNPESPLGVVLWYGHVLCVGNWNETQDALRGHMETGVWTVWTPWKQMTRLEADVLAEYCGGLNGGEGVSQGLPKAASTAPDAVPARGKGCGRS